MEDKDVPICRDELLKAGGGEYTINRIAAASISNMLDVNGDEIDDPKDAATIVAHLPNGEWLAAECEPSEIVKRYIS